MGRSGSKLRAVWSLLLAVVLLGQAHAALPETPRPRQLTVADGLPSNRINGIAEDHNGYLWIATSDGLARYDGIGFKVWREDNGLGDNFIWAVHVDASNRLWLGTEHAGLVMFDAQRKHFRRYTTANTPGMHSDIVWTVNSTADGAIWFGTPFEGLHRLGVDGKVTQYMPRAGDPRSLPGVGVAQSIVTPDGSLWVGIKGNGVARWTGRDFERVPDSALASPLINGFSVESDGTLWISTTRGVSVRRPDGTYAAAPWADAGMADTILHVLLRDRSGLYWFDVPQGLGRDNHGQMSVVPLYSGVAQGLVRPAWVSGYEDREGGVWFASNNNGLWYLPSTWRQFSVLSRRLDDPSSLGNAQVVGISPSSGGAMWLVGTGGMLDRLDPDTGQVQHIARDVGQGLVLDEVVEDGRGTVWVTAVRSLTQLTRDGRVLRRWTTTDPVDPMLPGDPQLAWTADGTLWLVSEDGVVQARDGDGRVIEQLRPGSERGLPADIFVDQISLGPDGAVWVAGSHGLFRWNAQARRFDIVPGAPAERLYGFAVDAKRRLWVARVGQLDAYDWDGTKLTPKRHLGEREGMPRITPNGLVVDASGIVWMSSTRGLLRVDPATGATRLYGVRDGLPSQEFDASPVARPSDGRILLGSPEGLVMFDPASVHPNMQPPHLIVETVDVRRGERRLSLPTSQPFEIEHGDRDLRIVARLLSFNDARNHVYRFRLGGYDNDWVRGDALGERVFSQLKPGRYQLQVSARTADNVWSKVQTLRFTVNPPWWQSWGAIAAFVGLGLLSAWWMANVYRKRLKRRHAWELAQQEREIAKESSLAKTRFLATLGHEVRTPMTGVLGMSELLLDTPLDRQQRGYVESIRRAGQHLLRLVNDALDLARIESGRLELTDAPFDLRRLVDEASSLMSPLAHRRGLGFDIELSPEAPHALRGDAVRVCQILLNLLGNAIKFTEQGRVSLRVAPLAPEGVVFEIIDTGPGLNDEQKARLFRRFEQAEGARTASRYGGSGLGLAISQELAEAMGGHIRVDSEPGQGARFIVELPLAVAPASAVPAPHTARGGQRPPLALLLVEDDPTVAEVVIGLLQAQGHRVTHAMHGLSALAEVAVAQFDAALLDLDLPGMDGLALAVQLRAQGFTGPMFAVTARADAEAEPQAMAAGFHGFLRKPVTGAMLAGLLEVVPRGKARHYKAGDDTDLELSGR